MKFSDFDDVNVGTSLTLTFALLIVLILGGGGLVVWQFRIASRQTDRLTQVSQQLVALQQLQEQLFTFHGRLEEIAQSKDANRLLAEAQPLISPLLQQTQRVRDTFKNSPSEIPADSFNAIDLTLPSQLEGITALARSGDWEAVNLRLANQLKPMEGQISALVHTTNSEVNLQMAQAVATMGNLQSRILVVVTTTALATFLVAAFFGWSIARRMIQLTQDLMNMRFEERLAERSRIAQDLHDSLLQGLLSASMQLHVAARQIPADAPAKPGVTRVLELMGEVVEEGRTTLKGLRSTANSSRDLVQSFSAIQAELPGRRHIDYRITVEGQSRPLHPDIRDEIFRIGREALLNAFRHSQAKTIKLELEYGQKQLRVLVRDDGVGIDAQVLRSGCEGHWGISGMRERAEEMGASLKLFSRAGAGTEVELSVPGGIAYESNSSQRSGGWFGRFFRRGPDANGSEKWQ
jgi:signal transduction histidine kinase